MFSSSIMSTTCSVVSVGLCAVVKLFHQLLRAPFACDNAPPAFNIKSTVYIISCSKQFLSHIYLRAANFLLKIREINSFSKSTQLLNIFFNRMLNLAKLSFFSTLMTRHMFIALILLEKIRTLFE